LIAVCIEGQDTDLAAAGWSPKMEFKLIMAMIDDQKVEAGELDESKHTGVALELDVSRATGLGDHIKALQEQERQG